MATTTITVVPLNTYAANTYAFGPVAVPITVSSVSAQIDLSHVTSLTLDLNWSLDLSQDNGATWQPLIGGGLDLTRSGYTLAVPGPGLLDSNGRAVPFCEIQSTVLNPGNSQRKARGSLTLSESMQTTVSVVLA